MGELLQGYYEQMAYVHGFTGLIGKLSLGCVVAVVAAGNRKPGHQLLVIIMALQFYMAAWLAWSAGADYPAFRSTTLVVAVICLVLALATTMCLYYREGEWNLRPISKPRFWIGWALITWGLYFPAFNDNWLRAIIFSPVSVLPHSTLIVGGAAAWLSMPNTNRLLAWAFSLGLVIVGGMDLFVGGLQSSIIPLGLGLLLAGEMLFSTFRAGGITADDVPPVDVERQRKVREVTKEKSEPQRTWKLK